jgi:two-component system response regulator (stage 0 sporulation protein A)
MLNGKLDVLDKMMYVYTVAAKHFGTTQSRVERAIRHMVEMIFLDAPSSVIKEYFGNTMSYNKGKINNNRFIACLVEYIKIHTDDICA